MSHLVSALLPSLPEQRVPTETPATAFKPINQHTTRKISISPTMQSDVQLSKCRDEIQPVRSVDVPPTQANRGGK
jgi:hypothetical protein